MTEITEKSLFATQLGEEAYAKLHPLLRLVHDENTLLRGSATITRGHNPVARLLCYVMGLPPQNPHCPLEVTIHNGAAQTQWQRRFGEHTMCSTFSIIDGFLVERLAMMNLWFKPQVVDGDLDYQLQKVSAAYIPLPNWLTPNVIAKESIRDRYYHFHVEVSLPVIGNMICYHGKLDIERLASHE